MRVIVCGGRDFDDADKVCATLDEIHEAEGITCIIHGGATGADRLAEKWGWTIDRMTVIEIPAEWKKLGKCAGPIRNSRMLEWNPDLVVAFRGGRGTADMVKKARAAGVRVRVIE